MSTAAHLENCFLIVLAGALCIAWDTAGCLLLLLFCNTPKSS